MPLTATAIERHDRSTGWRSQSDRQTVRKAWERRSYIGIARVADLTELDRVGIPVASVTRPLVHTVQVTATQGKGLTAIAAYASALMEAFERHAGSVTCPFLRASSRELRAGRTRVAAAMHPGNRAGDDTLLEWAEVIELGCGTPALAPASDIVFPYFPPAGIGRASRPSTTGLASGNTLDEAILHALFEVIERAAVSSAWEAHKVAEVPKGSLGPVERALFDRFEAAGASVFVVELLNAAAPTYSAYTYDAQWLGPPLIIGGHGTHLVREIAIRRALCEVAQSRIVALQSSREDLRRHETRWHQPHTRAAEEFEALRASCGSDRRPAMANDFLSACSSFGDAIAHVAYALRTRGYDRIYYRDLTVESIGIPVVRVLVPGLVDWRVQKPGG